MSQYVYFRAVSSRAIDAAEEDDALVDVLEWDITLVDPAALEITEPTFVSLGNRLVEVLPPRERERQMAAALVEAGLDASDLGTTHFIGNWWSFMGIEEMLRSAGLAALGPIGILESIDAGGGRLLRGNFEDGAAALSPAQITELHAGLSQVDATTLETLARKAFRGPNPHHELLRLAASEDEAGQFFPTAFGHLSAAAADAAARGFWLIYWVL